MENLGKFYYYLVYLTAIGNSLWPFGIFCGNLVYFPRFGILDKEKSGNPALQRGRRLRQICQKKPIRLKWGMAPEDSQNVVLYINGDPISTR
jgi:hypothetical protein